MIVVVLLSLVPVMLQAEYAPKELCVISWGNETNQLLIEPEELIYGSADSGDVEYHAGHGPTQGFVDSNENIFIISRFFSQLKCFDRNGNLILDKSNLAPGICAYKPYDAYLDSSVHFYLSVSPPLNYVPVADLQGNLINRLFPYTDTLKKIYRMYYDISGALFFWSKDDSTYVSYNQGQFKTIDNTCMKANDGYLYTSADCQWENPYAVKLIKYLSPERTDPPLSEDSIYIELPGDTVQYSELIIGGDGSRLYVMAGLNNDPNTYIYEIGLDYKIIDQISIPNPSERYPFTMSPFVDRQGHVYEFRFMDDGLHVIKWTKQ
jgi:hypothetical protein